MRKFFLVGIILTLLIAIPLTVFILTSQKTNTQSNANPSTILAFTIPQGGATVGTPVTIPVTVDPSGAGGSTSNQISFIKLVITYDGTKLQIPNGQPYFTPNKPTFSNLVDPSNTCDSKTNICTIAVTVTTGPDPSSAVSSQTTIGTLTFNPLVPTNTNSPTQLSFDKSSEALSIASTDQPAENVLALNRLQPGSLSIVAAAVTPADSPTPTDAQGSDGTSGGGGSSSGGTGSTGPACTLTADTTSSDSAPLTVLLTATGTDTGNITQVSYNFGDGGVQTITSGGGLGTSSVNVQTSHVYKTDGTFTATAVLTDNAGNTNAASSCSQTITIGNTTGVTPTTAPQVTAAPTIPSTGPGQVFIGIGIAGAVITAAGLLFAVGL